MTETRLSDSGSTGHRQPVAQGILAGWWAGIANHHFWWRFGVLDIRLRYRRTLLGPFWVTLSFALSSIALTIVFSTLFNISAKSYFAYLISGLAVWSLISSLVNEGCMTFIQQGPLLQQHALPVMAYALRSVVVVFLVFLHSLIVVILALLLFDSKFGWATLALIPGLAVILLNGIWMAMLFGMLCARYRDLPQISTTLTSIAFFVTPVFWYKDMLSKSGRGYIADLNPLYSLLELVRSPLLGSLPPGRAIVISIAFMLAGWTITYIYARRFQARLTYWV
jgi:ABC-type polysaccharide/polyol phosphate export permease